MGVTNDRNDPRLNEIDPNTGMQKVYLVKDKSKYDDANLKRNEYVHIACGGTTRIDDEIARTFASVPNFYQGTFCSHCKKHFPLEVDGEWQFRWTHTFPWSEFVGENRLPPGATY